MTGATDTLTREQHDSVVHPLRDQIEHQKHTIEKLQKALYGSKSEKIIVTESGEHQADLFIEEPSEPAREEERIVKEHRRRKPRTPRFPDDAEREIVDVELEGSERECGSCGKELQDIGYESSEQAHVIPARVQIRVIRRHKYACACKQSGVQIAPVQPSAFPKTQITDETRAHFLVQKYVDHRVPSKAMCEMRERPLAVELQDLVANRLELLRSRVGVVSVKEKARQTRQVGIGETSASEPLTKRRKLRLSSEPRSGGCLGRSVGDTCLLPTRRPALRRRESDSGSCMELGNLSSRCQGRSPSGSPARMRVPMRGTGAERSVVVKKVV